MPASTKEGRRRRRRRRKKIYSREEGEDLNLPPPPLKVFKSSMNEGGGGYLAPLERETCGWRYHQSRAARTCHRPRCRGGLLW
jgi:hypothetical protein